jgi:protoheme IX farnesyltransferase
MQPESILQSPAKKARTQRLLIITAIASYGLVLVVGGATPTIAATLLSASAITLLGAALFIYVLARLGPAPTQRLAGRAQAAQRRYLSAAFAAVGTLYLTLVLGTWVTNEQALWECLVLPICPLPSHLALVAMAHRALAALAAMLVGALAILTWRTRSAAALRRAAGWSIGLMLVQIAIGLVQVTLARGGNSPGVFAIRGAHLAVGAGAWAALVIQLALALRLPVSIVRRPSPSGYPVAEDGRQRTTDHGPRTAQAILKDYLSLTKPGVISLLIFTTVASMYITPAGPPSLWLVFWTFTGGWLMASGSHAINCYNDRDIDVLMGRTSRRPIPSNRIPAWHALVLGVTLGAVAFTILMLVVNWVAAALALAGLLYYVFVYTAWLKRSSVSNIVIGGGAGAFPPLVGWAAATGGLTLPALFLFAIIVYWTPPHFWALALIREKDYARASVPMLPVVAGNAETRRQIVLYTVQMCALTIMPTPLQMLGIPYMLMAIGLGALFLSYAIRLLREGTSAAAWALYKFSLLYLALLFAAMVVDRLVFT